MASAERISQGGGRIASMSAPPDFDYRGTFWESEGDSDGDADSQDSEQNATPIQSLSSQRSTPIESLSSQRSDSRPEKRMKKTPVPRAVVDELHIVELVKAYRREFALFCKGKKQTPKQMIPGKVWEKVFSHYRQLFPASIFEEDTLKKHLREQLAEMGTGIADDGQRPVLQDEDVGNEVRATDCAATRNILRLRQGFLSGVGNRGSSPLPTTASAPPVRSSAPSTPTPAAQVTRAQNLGPQPPPQENAGTRQHQETPTPGTPGMRGSIQGSASSGESRLTKSDMLHKQSEAVCSIARNFQDAAEKQAALLDAKKTKHTLALLKEAKQHGVLTEDEFKQKLKELLHL